MSEADAIIEKVRSGQTEAYAQIVQLYQKDVWRVVAAMLHRMETSRDVVQQVFVDAFMHLDQYQFGRDFGAWIKAIARNRVRQELRTGIRETQKLARYREQLRDRLQDEPAAERHDEAYLEALKRCREQLPDHAARVLALRYVEAQSFAAIAEREGGTAEAIQKMLSRIRLGLRTCIEARLAQA